MSSHIETVLNALHHKTVSFLPRGELFINESFLDHYFSEYKGQYVKQLETAAQGLGLSVIGVGLVTKEPYSLLSENRYRELDQYFLVGWINGPVSGLIKNHGFIDAMLSIRNSPSLFSEIAAKLFRDIEEKVKLAHANGMRAIAVADDIAGNKGLLFSHDYFLETVWPVYKEMAEIIKGNGLYTFFHSDGDMRKVMELLIEAGYDCIHPVDTQAGLNLYELKEEFGELVCFMGHIDIMTWSKERIQEEMVLAEKQFKKGGLIIGSTCGISMETASDNLNLLYPAWGKKK